MKVQHSTVFVLPDATGNSTTKPRQASFLVQLEIPAGITKFEMAEYIEEATATWKGQSDPELPIFDLDGDTVRAQPITKAMIEVMRRQR